LKRPPTKARLEAAFPPAIATAKKSTDPVGWAISLPVLIYEANSVAVVATYDLCVVAALACYCGRRVTHGATPALAEQPTLPQMLRVVNIFCRFLEHVAF
jgi:hypothetical protein